MKIGNISRGVFANSWVQLSQVRLPLEADPGLDKEERSPDPGCAHLITNAVALLCLPDAPNEALLWLFFAFATAVVMALIVVAWYIVEHPRQEHRRE